MKKSNRIKPIKALAEKHEQQAARAMGVSRQALQQQELRLQELCVYREEYLLRYREAGAKGIGASQLQTYQAFIRQLDEVIKQQRLQVTEASQNCENVTTTWRQKHMRTQVLDKTIQRFSKQEQKTVDKAEQREADDRSIKRPEAETE